MSTYAMSDLHGNYEGYKKMLKKIHFSDSDMLYILGDVIDRNEGGIRILGDMMLRPNVIPILGNHEYMMSLCAKFLLEEMTEESVTKVQDDPSILQGLTEWMNVGGSVTIHELKMLTVEEREDILDYLSEFSLLETVKTGGKDFILVHAGLANFNRNRNLSDYGLHEVLFQPPHYDQVYFPDKYLVTGHLPTRVLWAEGELTKLKSDNKDDIYIRNNHIAIDCGCAYGGRLGCIRFEDMAEFYE